ncbi:MAG TPA: prolyl oligopeptidase family serine peptidase [Steroidobacteraceae bacterium]|nr:prolyl oligopeptidase family serine peptidase [Steroidobacteraceae bacterium]
MADSKRRFSLTGALCLLPAACAALLLASCAARESKPQSSSAVPPAGATIAYPPARRTDHVDTYFGETVADPYRWMEDMGSADLHEWVSAENKISRQYLDAVPERDIIKKRLDALWHYAHFNVPKHAGERYFYLSNDGTQDQSVLYVTEGLVGAPRVLIDPNLLTADRTTAVSEISPSSDGRLLAYSVSESGSDWRIWRVRRVDSNEELPDIVRHTKFVTVAWDKAGAGFYYLNYPTLADGSGDGNAQASVYYHKLGTVQNADKHIYTVTEKTTRNPFPVVTDDGRYLLFYISDEQIENAIYYLDLAEPGAAVVRLFDRWDGIYQVIGNEGRIVYVWMTTGAPLGRVVAVDLDRPDPANWRVVVPEAAEAIDQAQLAGGVVVVSYLKDAHSVVRLHGADGSAKGAVNLPGIGTVESLGGRGDLNEAFFQYSDFFTPESIYRLEPRSNRLELFRKPSSGLDASRYVTEQVFYASKDGTKVPMFITHRRDLKLDGGNPVLLYGYGGFSLAESPRYRPHMAGWLEIGGVYALANLRGGAEYGEAWHVAGTKLAKQNVFDDFIAAAEWLIANHYTNPKRLAIHGRSNGGLLVGAVVDQRPDLFAAALPKVGVMDMLRYHTASANARNWGADFGLSENEAEYRALRAYSPYHNIHAGTCYPPTLITSAEQDDRVVPWHSYKYGAELQHAQGCANPVLVSIETRAGHRDGRPVWMWVEDYTDQWAFLAKELHMTITP